MTVQTTAIPAQAGLVDGWRFMPLEESGELMVAIGYGTEYDDIQTSAVYAGEHASPYRGEYAIDVATPIVYVRNAVADQLREAQRLLPVGLKLIVFDAYRSIEVQRALYDQFFDELSRMNPEWSDVQLRDATERYVSLPSEDTSCPSPHSTGGAVDVAIIKDGRMLEFGTPFDHGTKRSALRYFEHDTHVLSEVDVESRDNRRLLYQVMHEVGFEGFEHEWWHYNSMKTQMGARTAHRNVATYGIATELLPKSAVHQSRTVLLGSDESSVLIDRIAPTN